MISATLFHCLYDTIRSSLVFDRLKVPDHHKRYGLVPLTKFCLN